MASLVLKMSVSLDGYVASADGSTGWVAAGRSGDGLSWTVETVSNAAAHLIGAATYAGWAGYWPGASGPFAKPMNEIPKIVSNSLVSADWGETTISAGDLAEAVTRLKQERPDGYLLAHGGARFAPVPGRDRLDRRVPPRHPPGRPGGGRAALPRAAHHRTGEHHRLHRRSGRPRLRGAPVIVPDRQPGSGRCRLV
jgi:RibD C-terminal domain